MEIRQDQHNQRRGVLNFADVSQDILSSKKNLEAFETSLLRANSSVDVDSLSRELYSFNKV